MKRLPFLLLAAALAESCSKTATPAPARQAVATPQPASPPASVTGAPAAAPAPPKPVPAQLPAVLARVNGEAIEKWEFENALKGVEARAGGPVPPDRRDEVLREMLDQLIAYHVLAQESVARRLDVSDAELDAGIAQIKRNFPSEDAFTQGLAQQGLTLDQFRKQTRVQMQVKKVIDAEVAPKISVTDADVDAFYQQNLERFKQAESAHVSHILVALPPNATPAQKAAAKATAAQALKKIRGGGDFGTVARETSNDSSAQNGGDLGFVPRGQTVPAFEQAAFALQPGAVSGIVETQFGYHVIKLHEKRAARTASLPEAAPQIKQFLTQQQQEQKLQQFVAAAKAKAKIEVLI